MTTRQQSRPVLSRLAFRLAIAVLAAVAMPVEAAEDRALAVLHLSDGGFAAGALDDGAKAGVIRWRTQSFVGPFEFPVTEVNAIHWPPLSGMQKPTADYCFELAGGDVIFASLTALDERIAELEIPAIGRARVDRGRINRIYRWRDSADLIYLGPNGLAGWTETIPPRAATVTNARGRVRAVAPGRGVNIAQEPQPKASDEDKPPNHWREDSGQLVTEKEGASIGGDFDLPARASIEFEISWKTKPDFVLALGVNDHDRLLSTKRAFRFEAWGGDLVVQRELEHEADLAVVQELPPGPGRVHLNVYLDQEKGRILVFSQAGKRLADLKVAHPIPAVLPGIYLGNVRGDVRLEWLRIGRWSGELPRETKGEQARIHLADGSIRYGQVTRFDPAARVFVIQSETGESRVAQANVSSMFLAAPADEPARALRVVHQNGARLSGDLEKVDKQAVWLKVPGVSDPLGLPVAGLRSLVVLRQPGTRERAPEGARGRLELGDVRLWGRLVDGKASETASALVWQPTASLAASALCPGVSGRITYKEPRQPPSPPTRNANRGFVQFAPGAAPVAQAGGLGGAVARFTETIRSSPEADRKDGREPRSLYLRDGDVIPSTITAIDEKGVTFQTSISASTFVPHDKVKVVELAPEQASAPTVRLTRSKFDRLLTLPRMQKPSPPTQVIRSKNGDYLRGRVVKMDDTSLHVEVHLEMKVIPRDRISRIIWLHADELEETPRPPAAGQQGNRRVQALRNDGIRLTFAADQFSDSSLSGESDVLGSVKVAVREMDQLLIGGAIEQAAAQLAYHQWKLRNAVEPKFATDDPAADAGTNGTGTESPMVGKPAPDFTLSLLDGGKFHLASARGSVIVLDFWATWCGPCVQAMPQVERAARQFQDQGVRLVAVNLQESPEQIRAMLARHKFDMTVALDRDGAVADTYNAVAIPQTVIIGPKGEVARLFVGGGAKFEEQLKDALTAVLAAAKPQDPKK